MCCCNSNPASNPSLYQGQAADYVIWEKTIKIDDKCYKVLQS